MGCAGSFGNVAWIVIRGARAERVKVSGEAQLSLLWGRVQRQERGSGVNRPVKAVCMDVINAAGLRR